MICSLVHTGRGKNDSFRPIDLSTFCQCHIYVKFQLPPILTPFKTLTS